ncbi:MAG: hypothetical protein FWG10_05360 [Eubacteriaceae bacterium]|nr:hypothetical protein [Eubacteriaceae bacterium]
MTTQKNKYATLLLSIIPGCGYLYMGFLKKGLSVMAGINLIILLVYIIDAPVLLILISLLWFLSFFETLRLCDLEPDVFAAQKDETFISFLLDSDLQEPSKLDLLFNFKKVSASAISVTILGCFFLIRSITDFVIPYFAKLDPSTIEKINSAATFAPRLLICMVFFYIGGRLIVREKKLSNDQLAQLIGTIDNDENSPGNGDKESSEASQ